MKNAQTFCHAAGSRAFAKGRLRMGKSAAFALAALLAAAGLPTLAGCRNELSPLFAPEARAPADPAAPGSLSLTIGRGRARTIQPAAIGIDDFEFFSLYLTHENAANDWRISPWDESQIMHMAPGQWELVVYAHLPDPSGSGYVAAARTEAPMPFAVSPGQTTHLNVLQLAPIRAGEGWFGWGISLPPGATGWMTVEYLDGGTARESSVDALGMFALPAGQYRVHLFLVSDDDREVTISRLLNVYAGMTSYWIEAFGPGDFHRSFLDHFLDLRNGTWWDMSQVQLAHFEILRMEEGIEGVNAGNFENIRILFNIVVRDDNHPWDYSSADCLRALVDAALIYIGAQEFFPNDDLDEDEGAAEAAIRDFARNGTRIDFSWSDNRVIATIEDLYHVAIVAWPDPAPPMITFHGNGYTGLTLPEPIPAYIAYIGAEIELPVWFPDRQIDGYWFAFRGWSPDPSGFPLFNPGAMFTVSYQVILYAVWADYGFAFFDGSGMITGFSGGATNIFIPAVINGVSVTSIGSWAFANNQLDSVHIPDGIIQIGDMAFFESGLTTVVIPGGVASIGVGAFANNELTSVVIPDGVTYIGVEAFANNQLEEVHIPGGVASIGAAAFRHNQLTTAVIPDGVTYIGAAAFAHNELTSVDIPDGVASIGSWVFENNQLTSVVIPDGVTYIGAQAFADNQLTSVVIPDGVASIGAAAFANNWLTSVVIPDGVTYIGAQAFANNRLTSVYIPYGVASIGAAAFRHNELTTVVIPHSVDLIEWGAFDSNPLTSITIPADVHIELGDSMGMRGEEFRAFYNGTGRRAGTYRWIEADSWWILEGAGGGAAFGLGFAGFTDAAEGMGVDQASVSMLQRPALITVTGADFDEIRWLHDGAIVPGASGATLDFSDLHGGRIGAHFVNIEVRIDDRWYSRHIRISVTR